MSGWESEWECRWRVVEWEGGVRRVRVGGKCWGLACFADHPDHLSNVHVYVSIPPVLNTFPSHCPCLACLTSPPDGTLPHQVQTLCMEIKTMTGIPPHPNIVNALGYTFKGKTLSLLQTLAHHYSFINSLNLFSYCSHYIIFMKTLVCAALPSTRLWSLAVH